jgi:hypothetical protein
MVVVDATMIKNHLNLIYSYGTKNLRIIGPDALENRATTWKNVELLFDYFVRIVDIVVSALLISEREFPAA